MTVLIDPWGSSLIEDYEKLLKQFGLNSFSPTQLPNPNRLMRRRVNFASPSGRVVVLGRVLGLLSHIGGT